MCLINGNQKMIIIIIITIVIVIINKQINSDNHGSKYKFLFTQFPSEKIPIKCTVSPDPWVNCPKFAETAHPPQKKKKQKKKTKKKKKTTRKPGETSPFCAMNKYKIYMKNFKIYKIYIIFFSSDILQKGDVNQIKPTSVMYFLQFFIFFGTVSQIFYPKYLTD